MTHIKSWEQMSEFAGKFVVYYNSTSPLFRGYCIETQNNLKIGLISERPCSWPDWVPPQDNDHGFQIQFFIEPGDNGQKCPLLNFVLKNNVLKVREATQEECQTLLNDLASGRVQIDGATYPNNEEVMAKLKERADEEKEGVIVESDCSEAEMFE